MSYQSAFAGYYDLFYSGKNYQAESEYLHRIFSTTLKKKTEEISILEIACGTAGHASILAEYGYQIIATDISEDMLIEARKKTAHQQNVSVLQMDMNNFRVFTSKFDIILCLFDSIGYLLSNKAIIAALKNVSDNLKDDGLFIMEFWSAGAMLRSFEPHREKEFKTEKGTVKRTSDTTLDYINQMAIVQYNLFERLNNSTEFQLIREETHRNRFFMIQEMNCILDQAGLKAIDHFSGYSAERPDENSWHIISICQKV
jgi:SAM-dependent methyltransferase